MATRCCRSNADSSWHAVGFFFSRGSMILGLSMALTLALGPAGAQAQTEGQSGPVFSKVFAPDTIGPGSTAMLIFTIDNSDGSDPVDELAFADTLPAGMTLAAPAFVSNDCGGTVTAPDGGSTASLADGQIGAFEICQIVVNVTASVVEGSPYTNVTGDLTSDAGNSGTATDDLTVDEDLPGFTKSFAPSTVAFGERSTLTFTIDNSANASAAQDLSFTDDLPPGMSIASPANASTDCGTPTLPATLTAVPGTTTISLSVNGTFSFPGVPAGGTCTVVVDVTGGATGSLGNVSGELLADGVSAGKASDVLVVTGLVDPLSLEKEFVDDPVAPGGTVTLEFTVTNRDRNFSATSLAFSDDLDTTLTGLAPSGTLPTDPCGSGSTLAFNTGVLSLTGGSLPAEGSCTFGVPLDVPTTSTPGTYPNTTSTITGDIDGSGAAGAAAGDLLFVVSFPVLTKEFTDDPVGAGGTVTLEFTITNPETTSTMSDIEFIDELTDGSGDGGASTGFLPFPVSVTLPPVPDPPCGIGSSLALVSVGTDRQGLELTGGSLTAGGTAGDSCTFSVTLDIPVSLPSGTYTNTTEQITAVLDDFPGPPTVVGPSANDDVVVAGAPALSKQFTDDPVLPGGQVTLEFTLIHDEAAAGDATAVTFTDDLAATLAGLAATGPLPISDLCGPGNGTLTGSAGDTLLTVAGITLAPAEECTFSLALTVPGGAASGLHGNTTSDVTATVTGVTAMSAAASDDLLVTGLLFSKEFVDDPAIAGATTTLRFTLDNTAGTVDATAILFTDDLDDTLNNLAAVAPPPTPCGGTLTGTTFLTFSGGSVLAGQTCSFDVTVLVPAGSPDGTYNNTTSGLSVTIGAPTVLPPAVDSLVVDSALLELTKEFTDDPVEPGDTVTLEFTLTNLDSVNAASDIAFTDDLDAALSGLELTSELFNDCGATVTGTGTIMVTAGSLTAGGSCTLQLELTLPAAPLPAGPFVNTTSDVTGTITGLGVTGDSASDELEVRLVTFSKVFDGPTTATGSAVLTFTIENLDGSSGVFGLSFSDDLDGVITGMTASGLPATPCGGGSSLAGTSFLTLTGGNLAPGGSCSFDVTVDVPATAVAGTFPNVTSSLFSDGLPVADAATDSLTIEPAPTFAKVFSPDTIAAGGVSTLTFTIDNTASALDASALDFTDNLPAAVPVAPAPNASTTCTGGTLTAVAGTTVVTYTGGTVGAGTSCTVEVDVTSAVDGAHVNTTGDLTSSSGNSGTATDTLTVTPPPVPLFSKAFAPSSIVVGGVSTLTFTIDNTAGLLDATALDFTDNMPAAIVVDTTPNASTTCTGGTLTAAAGTSLVTYTGGTVPASASCTVDVDVTSAVAGNHVNVTGDLTSSAGNSGTATDTLEVLDVTAPRVTLVDSVTGTGDGELEECETARTSITSLEVTFDEAMFNPDDTDPNSVTNPANWLVVGSGADKDISTTVCGPLADDDVAALIDEVTWDGGSLTASVRFDALLPDGPHRLVACSGGMTDLSGNPLDGDGDGTGGDDFVRTFRVDRFDAFDNGNFDCSLDSWVSTAVGGTGISHSTEDVDDALISGSALFDDDIGTDELSLGQCVELLPESIYELSGFVRLDTAGAILNATRSCELFTSNDCSGAALPSQAFFSLIDTPDVWQGFANELGIPAGVNSGVCLITLRNISGLPWEAHVDDLSMDAILTMIIFRDGFESGDTSAWSTAVP